MGHNRFCSAAAAIARGSTGTTGSGTIETARAVLLRAARSFSGEHGDLFRESHGLVHWERVHHHACMAIECLPGLSSTQALEIEAAALLHDADDEKYFPKQEEQQSSNSSTSDYDRYASLYPNALGLLRSCGTDLLPESSHETVLFMIDAVSCSKNGNSVPQRVAESDSYHYLIPRWSDRIEAVGARGVWRCYQYNQESKLPLHTEGVTPRPKTEAELWGQLDPERFEAYTNGTKTTTNDPSMMGHYYDKLLHVACPPESIVRNPYLEEKLRDSARELVEVCLRYGRTGVVDVDYIRDCANR